MTVGPGGGDVGDDLGGRAVGQGEEQSVHVFGRRGINRVAGGREVRMDGANRLVAPATRGQRDDVDERVSIEDPDQLGADVAGRADDPDANAKVGARPAVRRDRRTRLEARAHGRARPFAEGCLERVPGIGWTTCMDA